MPFVQISLPEREVNHSPVSNVEVKNIWSYTYTPPYVFMARYFIKQADNYSYALCLILHHQRVTFSYAERRRLGGVMVIVLAIGSKGRGFKPGRGDGYLRAIKILSTPSL
jgi:hypothetical protein